MDDTTYHQVALLARSAAKRLEELKSEKMHRIHFPDDEKTLNKLYLWANQLERATAKKVRRQSEPRKAGKKSEKRKPKREAP
jgi:hypothetical protein